VVGGGLELAAAAHIRVAERSTYYALPEGSRGIYVGGGASVLLRAAERRPDAGFGILLIFVIFEFGFLVGAMLFAAAILQAIAWQEILVGNFLAAVAMGAFLWRQYPHIMKIIRP